MVDGVFIKDLLLTRILVGVDSLTVDARALDSLLFRNVVLTDGL
jgi:hypothetical protein